jgi:AcrR family transcriptional regulator
MYKTSHGKSAEQPNIRAGRGGPTGAGEAALRDSAVRDRAVRRTRILVAARRLMAEKGVKQTTLADIAREAGISPGTLFYHYASKNDLIYDILEKHLADLTDAIFASLPRRRDAADLAGALQNALSRLLQDTDSGRMNLYLLQEAIVGNGELRDRFAVRYQAWRELIAGQAARVFGVSDPHRLSALGALLLAMIDGLTIQSLLAPESVDLPKLAEELVRLLTAGDTGARPQPAEAG